MEMSSGGKTSAEHVEMTRAVDFCVSHHSGTILRLIKHHEKYPESLIFDAIAVFSSPLGDGKAVSLLSDKFTHSIVIMLNVESGLGLLVEYGHDGVLMRSGKLAKKKHRNYSVTRTQYTTFKGLTGFYACSMTLQRLRNFIMKFTSLAPHDMFAHNGQVFHRSLVASAVGDWSVYNVKQETTKIKLALESSHSWVKMTSHIKSRQDAINATEVLNMRLHHVVKDKEIEFSKIEKSAVDYDKKKHTIVQPKPMSIADQTVENTPLYMLLAAVKTMDMSKISIARQYCIQECLDESNYSFVLCDEIIRRISYIEQLKTDIKDCISNINVHIDALTVLFKQKIIGNTVDDKIQVNIMESEILTVLNNQQSVSRNERDKLFETSPFASLLKDIEIDPQNHTYGHILCQTMRIIEYIFFEQKKLNLEINIIHDKIFEFKQQKGDMYYSYNNSYLCECEQFELILNAMVDQIIVQKNRLLQELRVTLHTITLDYISTHNSIIVKNVNTVLIVSVLLVICIVCVFTNNSTLFKHNIHTNYLTMYILLVSFVLLLLWSVYYVYKRKWKAVKLDKNVKSK